MDRVEERERRSTLVELARKRRREIEAEPVDVGIP